MENEEIITKLLEIKERLPDVKSEDIKQIEEPYILLYNGNLYEYNKLIDTDVDKIYVVEECYYKIKKDNTILPIDNIMRSELDYYLNNKNCKYKKIVTNEDEILALTKDGDVRAFISGSLCIVIPENYKNVDDVLYVENEYTYATPYIVKNNKQIPLNSYMKF